VISSKTGDGETFNAHRKDLTFRWKIVKVPFKEPLGTCRLGFENNIKIVLVVQVVRGELYSVAHGRVQWLTFANRMVKVRLRQTFVVCWQLPIILGISCAVELIAVINSYFSLNF
jgi:hypothetical protein